MSKNILTKPAVKVQQGDQILYATTLTVGDFQRPDFYKVDRLDATKQSGYQRLLDERRVNRLAKLFRSSWKEGGLFIPTAILLATEKKFDRKNGNIDIDLDAVCPFNVVDGQHRIMALTKAATEDENISAFAVSVNIVEGMPVPHQMVHFYIVNTTQKSVDQGVAQQIKARLSEMSGFEQLPHLPDDLKRDVRKSNDQMALQIIGHLNQSAKSPWNGRIQMADERADSKKVRQATFVNIIKQMILTPNHPLIQYENEKRKRMLENYWRAVCGIFIPPGKEGESVVLKNNGVWFFHYVSATIFAPLSMDQDFTVSRIRKVIRKVLDHLAPDAEKIAMPEWWLESKRGDPAGKDRAGRLNRSALYELAKSFNEAAIRSRESSGEKIKL